MGQRPVHDMRLGLWGVVVATENLSTFLNHMLIAYYFQDLGVSTPLDDIVDITVKHT